MSRQQLLETANELQKRLEFPKTNVEKMSKQRMLDYIQRTELIDLFKKVFTPRRAKTVMRSLVQASQIKKKDIPVSQGVLKRFSASDLRAWIKKVFKQLQLPTDFSRWKTQRLQKYIQKNKLDEITGRKTAVPSKSSRELKLTEKEAKKKPSIAVGRSGSSYFGPTKVSQMDQNRQALELQRLRYDVQRQKDQYVDFLEQQKKTADERLEETKSQIAARIAQSKNAEAAARKQGESTQYEREVQAALHKEGKDEEIAHRKFIIEADRDINKAKKGKEQEKATRIPTDEEKEDLGTIEEAERKTKVTQALSAGVQARINKELLEIKQKLQQDDERFRAEREEHRSALEKASRDLEVATSEQKKRESDFSLKSEEETRNSRLRQELKQQQQKEYQATRQAIEENVKRRVAEQVQLATQQQIQAAAEAASARSQREAHEERQKSRDVAETAKLAMLTAQKALETREYSLQKLMQDHSVEMKIRADNHNVNLQKTFDEHTRQMRDRDTNWESKVMKLRADFSEERVKFQASLQERDQKFRMEADNHVKTMQSHVIGLQERETKYQQQLVIFAQNYDQKIQQFKVQMAREFMTFQASQIKNESHRQQLKKTAVDVSAHMQQVMRKEGTDASLSDAWDTYGKTLQTMVDDDGTVMVGGRKVSVPNLTNRQEYQTKVIEKELAILDRDLAQIRRDTDIAKLEPRIRPLETKHPKQEHPKQTYTVEQLDTLRREQDTRMRETAELQGEQRESAQKILNDEMEERKEKRKNITEQLAAAARQPMEEKHQEEEKRQTTPPHTPTTLPPIPTALPPTPPPTPPYHGSPQRQIAARKIRDLTETEPLYLEAPPVPQPRIEAPPQRLLEAPKIGAAKPGIHMRAGLEEARRRVVNEEATKYILSLTNKDPKTQDKRTIKPNELPEVIRKLTEISTNTQYSEQNRNKATEYLAEIPKDIPIVQPGDFGSTLKIVKSVNQPEAHENWKESMKSFFNDTKIPRWEKNNVLLKLDDWKHPSHPKHHFIAKIKEQAKDFLEKKEREKSVFGGVKEVPLPVELGMKAPLMTWDAAMLQKFLTDWTARFEEHDTDAAKKLYSDVREAKPFFQKLLDEAWANAQELKKKKQRKRTSNEPPMVRRKKRTKPPEAGSLTTLKLPKKLNPMKVDVSEILEQIPKFRIDKLKRYNKQLKRERKKYPNIEELGQLLGEVKTNIKLREKKKKSGLKSRLLYLF